jgi:AMIN domain
LAATIAIENAQKTPSGTHLFMRKLSKIVLSRLLLAALCAPLAAQSAHAQASIRGVKVLGNRDAVEIEVETSAQIVPQTRVLTGPDRLVIDFPNAVPGSQLRSQSVYRGEVKDLRIGLFQSKPPVTRVVLDLNSAQSFEVFPDGRSVMIKVSPSSPSISQVDYPAESRTRPSLVTANYTTRSEGVRIDPPVIPPPAPLQVIFSNGRLGIKANKATLSEVLFAVQQRTGAEIAIPAGAELEQVAVDIPPAPAPEVLASLLNGSKFNFLILSAANDPERLDRVILSLRSEGGPLPLSPVDDLPVENGPPPQPSAGPGQPPTPVVEPAQGPGPPQPEIAPSANPEQ